MTVPVVPGYCSSPCGGLSPQRHNRGGLRWLASTFAVLLALCLTVASAQCASANATVEAMAGQMLMLGFRGAEPADAGPILRSIAAGHVGGVILFDRDMDPSVRVRNIVSKEQLSRLTGALQAAAPVPLFIAVDQEGGRVRRQKPEYGFFAYPSAASLGKGSPEDTRRMASTLATEMAEVGLNVDFGPVVDLAVNPSNPVIARLERSYGSDPCRVAAHAAAFVNGLAWRGVVASLKHFPGHGSSLQDSHLGVTDISSTWRREELGPYALLLRDDWAGMVMVGHLYNNRIDAAHPATLSQRTIDGLLRRDLGWKGVVVTDDLQMGAITARYSLDETVRLAVEAGADILLFGNNLVWDEGLAEKVHATLVRLVREGKVSEQRLRQSWERIMRLKSVLTVASPGAIAQGDSSGTAIAPVPAVPDPTGAPRPLRLTLPMPRGDEPLCRDRDTLQRDPFDDRQGARYGRGTGIGIGVGTGTGIGIGQ